MGILIPKIATLQCDHTKISENGSLALKTGSEPWIRKRPKNGQNGGPNGAQPGPKWPKMAQNRGFGGGAF